MSEITAAASVTTPIGPVRDMSDATCIEDGCGGEAERRGYCSPHYRCHLRRAEIGRVHLRQPSICVAPDCDRKPSTHGYCKKHYQIWAKYGDALRPATQEMDLPGEEWRPVFGYEGFYEVSDLGRVRSLPRATSWGGILKASPGGGGYLTVSLSRRGVIKDGAVHRLVAAAFIGRCPAGQEVRHLDGDQLNNKRSNLCYGTRSENTFDRVRHGTHRCSSKTHCPQGHEYAPENTRVYIGKNGQPWRRCRTCEVTQRAERYQRDRERKRAA